MNRSNLLGIGFPLLVGIGLPIAVTDCSAAQKRDEKKALDFTQMLCVLSHAPATPAEIATACSVAEVFIPLIEQILSEHQRAALRQYGSVVVPSASASGSSSALVIVPVLPPSAAPAASASAAKEEVVRAAR